MRRCPTHPTCRHHRFRLGMRRCPTHPTCRHPTTRRGYKLRKHRDKDGYACQLELPFSPSRCHCCERSFRYSCARSIPVVGRSGWPRNTSLCEGPERHNRPVPILLSCEDTVPQKAGPCSLSIKGWCTGTRVRGVYNLLNLSRDHPPLPAG